MKKRTAHTFIGPFLELLVVACLFQEVQNGNSELGIRQRVGLWVYTTLCSRLQQQQSQCQWSGHIW